MAFSRTHSLLARAGSTSTYKRVWRYWYPLMTRGLGNDEIVFINWAYEEDPPMDLPLEASDEPNRAHINLYHRTATQVDLGGKCWRSVADTAAEPLTSHARCTRPPTPAWT